VTRLAAEIGKKYFSQPLVVVAKLGGSGTVGASEVINSKPDGYKILYFNHNYFATTVRSQKISFDPNYLVPLANYIELIESIGVSGDSPWKTLDQLLDYGRKNPGKIRHGHGGRGTGGHMLDWLIYKKAGVEITDVPYIKGSVELIPPLLGGHIDSGHLIYSSVKSQIAAGKIRLLVTHGDQRFKLTPNVPCATELGFPTFTVYHGFYVHKDTPEDIKKTLFETLKKIYEDPEFMKAVEQMGDAPKFGGPEFLKEQIRRVEQLGVPLLKECGLYVGEPPSSR
jgi:tripartite-type tricarboxylate transporter receptor subunit TctC